MSAPSCASSFARCPFRATTSTSKPSAPAVPIFAGTRPFEALPFQWSCHIETSAGQLAHAEFLDLGAAPPMRRLAESLLATLGTTGPIVVYTPYERRVLRELAARYADLAAPLAALAERIVDLHPPTRQHYYHPAMQGSWSIKAVLPTVAPDLELRLARRRSGRLRGADGVLRSDRADDVGQRAAPRCARRCSTIAGRTRSRSCGSWSSSAARG